MYTDLGERDGDLTFPSLQCSLFAERRSLWCNKVKKRVVYAKKGLSPIKRFSFVIYSTYLTLAETALLADLNFLL